jgi:two-component system KDP operon response regulator KdpE
MPCERRRTRGAPHSVRLGFSRFFYAHGRLRGAVKLLEDIVTARVPTSESLPLPPRPATPLTVLVVDDEPQIRRIVRGALQGSATRVVEADSGAAALEEAAAERLHLVVLDLGLPDMSGTALCAALRDRIRAPILVLSARHSDAEKVELLDAGADDYMTKPFSTAELQARVRALLRRAARGETADADTRIESGDLVIDLVARTLTVRGDYVHLTRTEWELLRVLATQAGRTLTHRQLFREVWSGRSYGDAQQYLRVQVAHLRRKIEDDVVRPRYLVTEPGVGYRFNLVEPRNGRRA